MLHAQIVSQCRPPGRRTPCQIITYIMAACSTRISDTVDFIPKSIHTNYDPAEEKGDLGHGCVVPFKYIIPSFQFLSVDVRQMRIKDNTNEGEERTYMHTCVSI